MSRAVTWLRCVVRNRAVILHLRAPLLPEGWDVLHLRSLTSPPADPQCSDTWKLPRFLYMLMKAVQWKTKLFKWRFSKQETFKLCPWECSFTFTILCYSRILWLRFQLFSALPRMFPKPAPRALFKDMHLILLLPSGGFCCLRTSAIVSILFPSLKLQNPN